MTIAPVLASTADVAGLVGLRSQAEDWLAERGIQQWGRGEVTPDEVASQIARGEWFVWRDSSGRITAALRYLDRDADVWPDDPPGRARYVHGLMADRHLAPPGAGAAALSWAEQRAVADGTAYLRLDCVESNARLRRFYRDQGYAEVGRRDFPGPWLSACLLEKDLSG